MKVIRKEPDRLVVLHSGWFGVAAISISLVVVAMLALPWLVEDTPLPALIAVAAVVSIVAAVFVRRSQQRVDFDRASRVVRIRRGRLFGNDAEIDLAPDARVEKESKAGGSGSRLVLQAGDHREPFTSDFHERSFDDVRDEVNEWLAAERRAG
ncbi:MAG: hypothetical protein R3323_03950 [Wenzhouxiangellaceae bacterium]|nr:hypothetical protein [Wenzhouxiangellaceae bacterium]